MEENNINAEDDLLIHKETRREKFIYWLRGIDVDLPEALFLFGFLLIGLLIIIAILTSN